MCMQETKNKKLLPCGLTALSVFLLLQNLVVNSPLVSAMGKDGAGITDAAGKVVYTGTQVAEQIDKLPSSHPKLFDLTCNRCDQHDLVRWLAG